jgi:hypothetical protein
VPQTRQRGRAAFREYARLASSGSSIRWIGERAGFGLAAAVGGPAIAVRAIGTGAAVMLVRATVAARTTV